MTLAHRLTGLGFATAGTLHFAFPRAFAAIVPPRLPAPRALVILSGVAEAAGGIGLLQPRTRRPAGWLLAATLVVVFPANVEMARHPERFRVPGGRALLIARLPLQPLLIAWVLRIARGGVEFPR